MSISKLGKNIVIASAIGLSISSSAFAAAVSPIVVVDLSQVFQQVPQGQAAFNQLQKQLAPQSNQLQNQQTALNKQIQAYQNNKANLTPSQQSAQAAQLLQQQGTLQQSLNTYQSSVQKQQQVLLTTFGDQMKSAVSQIAKNNHYTLILSSQTALYNDGSTDITPQVIAAMKNQ